MSSILQQGFVQVLAAIAALVVIAIVVWRMNRQKPFVSGIPDRPPNHPKK
ncbi:MAG: hypothetical protein KBC26_02080 [Candidatus Pacebacteria bacterium]|nr:hypothetical protein [Candidatus Paceibacterota bacterium]